MDSCGRGVCLCAIHAFPPLPFASVAWSPCLQPCPLSASDTFPPFCPLPAVHSYVRPCAAAHVVA